MLYASTIVEGSPTGRKVRAKRKESGRFLPLSLWLAKDRGEFFHLFVQPRSA
jgi:hypothetical protein